SLITPVGKLLDDPAARAVLQKHIPEVVGSPQIAMAREITLSALQSFVPQQLTPAVMQIIDAELSGIPSK
ncbi:MAG: carboxylesterase, partial [Sphingomicrobium sp.]